MRSWHQPKISSLAERLMRLRMTAASLYDAGTAKGATQEELQELIAPLTQKLGQEIQSASKEDLPGVALAVEMLENQVAGYKESVKFLLQKIADDEYHAGLLRQAVMDRMKAQGLREAQQHGFSAVITGEGDKESIRFR